VETTVGAVDVHAADRDQAPRRPGERVDDGAGVGLPQRTHVEHHVGFDSPQGGGVVAQPLAVAVEVRDPGGEVGLVLAPVEDRYPVPGARQPAHDPRPDEARPPDHQHPHGTAFLRAEHHRRPPPGPGS